MVALRQEHPCWGGRKLARILRDELGSSPSASTITEILRREGLLTSQRAGQPRGWQRFEHERPNDLWQMDFKGHFAMQEGRCHPFDVLDDCSRFSLRLSACADQKTGPVKEHLAQTFRLYGMPLKILADNENLWRSGAFISHLRIWLMRLGIQLVNGRPAHPQTQGKLERFHKTLDVELLSGRTLRDLEHAQREFDRWRSIYNLKRPHESLGQDVPVSRYTPSPRAFPETLPSIEYGPADTVRKVQQGGEMYLRGRIYELPKALTGLPVAIRPSQEDGVLEVYFMSLLVKRIDLRQNQMG